MSSTDRKFEMHIDLPASRDEVWAAISEAREIARWFAPDVEVDPRVGGAMKWEWADHHRWPLTIEVFEPGQHLRTRYDSTVDDGAGGKRPLFVDFFLEGDSGTTTLRLVHHGFGPESDFDMEFDGISGGWPVELRSLQHYLTHHRGRDRMLAWAVKWSQVPAAEAWARLTGAGGLALAGLPDLAEGAAYAFDVPGAGPIAGQASFSKGGREFSGTVANLDNGRFRVHCERWDGSTQIWLWLALYEGSPQRAATYQQAFGAVLDGLFGTNERAAGATA